MMASIGLTSRHYLINKA